MNSKQVGDFGEDLASKFLTEKGYLILSRNYSCKSGEVDIIAKISNILVFVEVKTRKNDDFIYAREAVNLKKQERIRSTARKYIFESRCRYEHIRFDVIEIYTQKKLIGHFEDAF